MEYSEGIFNPQIKIHQLRARNYLITLATIEQLKAKYEKSVNQSPRIIKKKKLLDLFAGEKRLKDLEETYDYHSKQHPLCPLLTKMKLEIKKRQLSGRYDLNFPDIKYKKSRPQISLTPNPRMKFSETLAASKFKILN